MVQPSIEKAAIMANGGILRPDRKLFDLLSARSLREHGHE
jgi:hypothetical protein